VRTKRGRADGDDGRPRVRRRPTVPHDSRVGKARCYRGNRAVEARRALGAGLDADRLYVARIRTRLRVRQIPVRAGTRSKHDAQKQDQDDYATHGQMPADCRCLGTAMRRALPPRAGAYARPRSVPLMPAVRFPTWRHLGKRLSLEHVFG